MEKIFELSTKISTPLALAGFFASAFFFIARQILNKNIFPKLSKEFSIDLLKLIINRFFWASIVAMSLGFIGYALNLITKHESDAAPQLINTSIKRSSPQGRQHE